MNFLCHYFEKNEKKSLLYVKTKSFKEKLFCIAEARLVCSRGSYCMAEARSA